MNRYREIRRPGFTITELLIVIGIIGVLAGLAIYFVPSFNTSAKAARGAADLQQSILMARQRAIRDQAPRGLRILFDTTTGLASKCQFLEQPDDLGAGRYFDSTSNSWLNLQLRASPDNDKKKVWVTDNNGKPAFNFGPVVNGQFSGADGINFTDDDPPVQVGDYLEVNGSGLSHYIVTAEQSDKVNKPTVFDVLVLASEVPQTISTATKSFRIIRQPRVVGDETFDLPRSIVIDGNTNTAYASLAGTANFIEALPVDFAGNLDIMFSPAGVVMPGKTSRARIYLWVRHKDYDDKDSVFNGEPTLIVVSINSGLVAAYPVNVGNAANPYDLTPQPW